MAKICIKLLLVLVHIVLAANQPEIVSHSLVYQGASGSVATLESSVNCFSQLHQLANLPRHAYVQTASLPAAVSAASFSNYTWRGVLGRVVTIKDACLCADGTNLIPAHLLYNGQFDMLLTTNQEEMTLLREARHYRDMRIDFYCSPQPNKCGATQPLYRHVSPSFLPLSHVYTTRQSHSDEWGTYKWNPEGITCYIWPAQLIWHDIINI